jgi:site-specific recombinase XerD
MDNATVLQKFEQHLRRRSPDRSTPIHYVSDVRQFQHLCPKPWSEVTRADIEAFLDHGLAQGWKPATLQRRVAALKVFFDFCADESEQEDRPNPVQPSRHAPRRGERLPRDLPDALVEQLSLLITHPRDQVCFMLMLRGGLRVGEVVALTRGDVLARATPDSPARLRVIGKGRKERIVYLSADAYAVLERHLQAIPPAPDTPLLLNRHGQRMTVNGVQERLRQYAAKLGVSITCHQLRHTFARQLVEHELPVTTLAKLMGHSALSTTQGYIAGADPQVRQAYQAAMSGWMTESGAALPSPLARELSAPTPPVPTQPAPPAPLVTFETWGTSLPSWVRAACLAYVQHRQKDWKPSRRKRNGARLLRALSSFWRIQLQQRPLEGWSDLRRADLQAFISRRVEQGRAPTTVTNEVYALLGVLRMMQEQGESIPESVFRVELPKDPELAPRYLPEAEALRLEQHMRTYLTRDTPEGRRDAVGYFLLAHTGLRLSELLDLKRGDVDLAGQRLRIEEAKGRRDRVVYLSQTCVQALERYLAGQPAAPEVALLYHPSGRPVSYRWVQEKVRQWGEAAGVAGVSPHRLRHTFATQLINLGVPVTTLQRLLGHRDLGTTQRYAQVMDPTAERQYHQAMAQIECTLSLAPVPLSVLTGLTLPERLIAVPIVVTKDPLDNSL